MVQIIYYNNFKLNTEMIKDKDFSKTRAILLSLPGDFLLVKRLFPIKSLISKRLEISYLSYFYSPIQPEPKIFLLV